MKSQRILIVCQHFWPESFRINDLADFFIEQGYEVDVLCGIPNYPVGKFFDGYGYFSRRNQTNKNVKIRRVLEIPRGSNSNFRIFINYLSYPFFSLFHIPRLLFVKYDKVFIYQLSPVMMSIAGIIIGKIKRIEITMYVLDLWPENLFSVFNVKNLFLRSFITVISHWHYKMANKIIVLSELMKKRLSDITSIENSKIVVIPQACEKIYESDVTNHALAKRFANGFNIVYTGNISPAQSFETILDAAEAIQSSGITNINWIIIGDGMTKKWLEQEVNKRGLQSSFYFEGMKAIEIIPEYTSIADILIGCLVKSDLLEATIPAKVMSYIAAGKPIVLAMDGEVADLINCVIKCGFVGPAGDAFMLTKNIMKLYQMPKNQREILGMHSREYHNIYFSRDILLTKLLAFIES